MFTFVGYKIMVWAKALVWINIVVLIIAGVITFLSTGNIMALLLIAAGIFCIPLYLLLYGLGQMIQEVHMILEKVNPSEQEQKTL